MVGENRLEVDGLRNPGMDPKWRNVRVRQELVDEVKREIGKKKGRYPSLSEFVTEAVQLRLQTLAEEERLGEPIALGLEGPEEPRIWNLIAAYNRNKEECEHKEGEISTILADFHPSLSACALTGIQCSLYTCPRAETYPVM